LYIRCALTTEQFRRAEAEKRPEHLDDQRDWRQLAKNTPDFFYTTNMETPVIPGSSLRGMLRALVEIVSYSKMSRVTKERLFFRTVDDSSLGASYGKRMTGQVRGGWLTLSGREANIEEVLVYKVPRTLLNILFPNGIYDGRPPNYRPKWAVQQHSVFIKIASHRKADANSFGLVTEIRRDNPNSSDWLEGTLVITGDIPGKEHEFVFVKSSQHRQWAVNEETVRRFHDDDQITLWQRNAFPKHKPFSANRQRNGMLPRDAPEPVFFLVSDENPQAVIFFGRAGMFRLPYLRSPYDFISEIQRFSESDLAEMLFGHVAINDIDTRTPIAGRISVSDATYVSHENQLWLAGSRATTLTPHILSGPKPTSFQHYLVQDKVNGQPRAQNRKRLSHYDSSTSQTTLRGHKLYWHKQSVTREDVEDAAFVNANDTQHTQFRPINTGVTFSFTIHFENLSKIEFGALLWVLRLCDDNHTAKKDGPYRLKIGMAKPLGMGTIKLTTTVIKQITHEQRYTKLLDESNWVTGEIDLPQELQDASIRDFEQYVLELSGEQARGYDNLAGTLRMRCLLALLRWPGPIPQQTIGMELSTFRYRPVLPTPLGVIGEAPPQPVLSQGFENRQSEPANITPVETRMRGTITQTATSSRPGRITSAQGVNYEYDIDDIIGAITGEEQSVLFRPGKKKMPRGKDKKNVNWAYDVEATVP
jgi:CRISPR-associated protein (TIGR03986 family)